jgi:hypothetical protein
MEFCGKKYMVSSEERISYCSINTVTCNVTVDGYWIVNWIYCTLQPIITAEYLNSSTTNSVDSFLSISLCKQASSSLLLAFASMVILGVELLHGPRYIAWELTP